jgi:hypothetical protein
MGGELYKFIKYRVITQLRNSFKGYNLKYHFMTEIEVKLQTSLTFTVDEGGLPVS